MAYSKQTWTDDVSAVTGARMTHIEQGIYDNSIATDKINPSGTATTTAEIEEGQINDVIGFKSLKLKGQTSQYTTTGKNKFDYTTSAFSVPNNVSIVTSNDTITITTAQATTSNNLFFMTKIPDTMLTNGTTYTISSENVSGVEQSLKLQLRNKDGTNASQSQLTSVAYNDTYSLYVVGNIFSSTSSASIASGTKAVIKNVQVESGSTSTTYEKYSGGKASPNPDFPQDVNNVSGDNVIGISNKNINSSTLEAGNISNGANTTDNNVVRSKDYIMVTPSTAYVFSINGTANKVVVSMYDENKVFLTNDGENGYASSNGKFTTYSNAKYIRYRSYSADKSLFESGNIQLEKGTSATSYIAHQGNDFEINLPVENKLPYPYVDTTKTNNGITYTDLGDGRIRVNGTATANSAFALYGTASSQISLKANYVYGGVNSNVRVRVMNRSSGGTYTTLGNSIGTSTKIDRSTISTGYVEISIASGTIIDNVIVTPMLTDGEINAYTPYGTKPIFIGNISTYYNDIRKYNGKWFWHKEIDRLKCNGSEVWTAVTTNVSGKYRPQINLSSIVNANIVKPSSNANVGLILCDYYKPVVAGSAGTYGANEGISLDVSGYVQTYNDDYTTNDISLYKTWLASNNITIYWVYSTPIDEEITYAPLLRQLDELYNSGLYDITNISQDNSSEAFILDLEACKNNINGIVEYIRR